MYKSTLMTTFVLILSAAVRAGGFGTVSGTVTQAGRPVVNARVTVYNSGLFYFGETRTALDGTFSFDQVPVGPKFLGVAALGLGYQEVLIDVSTGFDWIQDFALLPEDEAGAWEIVGNTLDHFFDATDIGILLPDGRIFYCHNTVEPVIFDPASGVSVETAGSLSAQGCMNSVLLDDGSLLLAGGQDGEDPGDFVNGIPWVKTYTPTSDVWQQLPDLQHKPGRWYPGLARLADGSLLIMGGGQSPDASRTETCELFDLETQTWSYTDSMISPTEFPPSALLYTGDVLATWAPVQLFKATTQQWEAASNFLQPDRGFPGHSDHSLIIMADGRAIALGIRGNPVMGEIYDPITDVWSATSNPDLLRFQSEVVQLPDGRILVAGGETEDLDPPVPDVLGIVKWTDLYDPTTDAWRRVADMNDFREYHAVTLLVPDGRVMSTGGTRIQFQVGPTTTDIEAYSPPYLSRGVRPEITAISSIEPRRGETITLEIAPQTQLTSVVVLGMQTTTHWVDAGVPRRLVMPVEQSGSTATFTLPLDPNIAMLGHYMVFAMVDDIPSVAEVIRIRSVVGDINGDGLVDVSDLLMLLAVGGPCDGCAADIDGDGTVGIGDLLLLLGSWS